MGLRYPVTTLEWSLLEAFAENGQMSERVEEAVHTKTGHRIGCIPLLVVGVEQIRGKTPHELRVHSDAESRHHDDGHACPISDKLRDA